MRCYDAIMGSMFFIFYKNFITKKNNNKLKFTEVNFINKN